MPSRPDIRITHVSGSGTALLSAGATELLTKGAAFAALKPTGSIEPIYAMKSTLPIDPGLQEKCLYKGLTGSFGAPRSGQRMSRQSRVETVSAPVSTAESRRNINPIR